MVEFCLQGLNTSYSLSDGLASGCLASFSPHFLHCSCGSSSGGSDLGLIGFYPTIANTLNRGQRKMKQENSGQLVLSMGAKSQPKIITLKILVSTENIIYCVCIWLKPLRWACNSIISELRMPVHCHFQLSAFL